MAFGFTEQDQERILNAIQKFSEIERTIIFGSRAMGNFKKASDVDLAIVGKNITSQTLIRLRSILNDDLPRPYFFDVVVYEKITNANLKQHIDEHGIEKIPVQTSAIQMTSIAFLVENNKRGAPDRSPMRHTSRERGF